MLKTRIGKSIRPMTVEILLSIVDKLSLLLIVIFKTYLQFTAILTCTTVTVITSCSNIRSILANKRLNSFMLLKYKKDLADCLVLGDTVEKY